AVDLHAQTQALGFYERLGYTAYGPEELEAASRRARPSPLHRSSQEGAGRSARWASRSTPSSRA
ncbi:hypothetical protein ACWD25_36050, partial [Streptomyces sp. NPDC002920]